MSDWRSEALCAGIPGFEYSPREAVKTCRQCPVIQACFDTHLADRDFEGIAAGLTWTATTRSDTVRKGRRVA